MSPNFLDNSFVLCLRYPWQSLQVTDVILVRHHSYGVMIKRIIDISPQGLWLVGDHASSTSTQKMGLIPRSAVLGKVIAYIPPTK